jgi:4-amino-4-deoxy-L-arabinose transferase-like glycosyltransferase
LLALIAARPWWRRLRAGDGRLLLLLLWVLLVLLFFSASPGKREVYILPALPAFALAFGPLLTSMLGQPPAQRTLFILTGLLASVISVGSIWALYGEPQFASRIAEQHGVRPWGWFLLVGLIGLSATAIFRNRAHYAYATLMIALWSGYGLFGYPGMNDARSGKALMARVDAALPAGAVLALASAPEQMLLQAPPSTRAFGFKMPIEQQLQAAFDWLRESPEHWLLTHSRRLGNCISPDRSVDVGWSNRRHWYLLTAEALEPGCTLATPGLARDQHHQAGAQQPVAEGRITR